MRVGIGSAVVLGFFGVIPAAQGITGLEIMQERERRHERSYEESWVSMHLYDKRGKKKEERLMVTYSRQSGRLDRRLMKFANPADIRGVGLLTWEQPAGREDDQWLYLPASKKVKRIAGSGKKNQFMGTDLAYEDLRPENLSAHDYQLVGETKVDGHKCWMIVATPKTAKEKRDSGYSKRTMYTRQDVYFTIKTEYYGKRGRLEKVGILQKVVPVAGRAYRANLAVMQRMKKGTKTIIVHRRRTLDKKLDESLFTQQGLSRPVTSR